MLVDFLENLQNKPKRTRVLILWAGTAIFMTILFVLWAWTFDSGVQEQSKAGSAAVSEGAKAVSDVKEEIPSLWESLKAGVQDILKSENVDQGQIEAGTNTSAAPDNSAQPKTEVESPAPSGATQETVPASPLP
ncbi:MAG: hypothetical protein V1845_03880 [bacterium]